MYIQDQGLRDRSNTYFILHPKLASSNAESPMSLQNISIPTPFVSFFPLRVLDGSKPFVEPRQPLNGLGVAYIIGVVRLI